ncbi:MAG TPA: ribosome small subunit-dependent GTPase A [Tepidisphaeraceae bacterium]|jgi:ribosome biogenesis GTPase|nr:ribosome small subunit-dependent GTPase A [Tepidisphaeraceae bacterium]
MPGKSKKGQREKDLTSRYLSGGYDEDRADSEERFSPKSKAREQDKIARTAVLRADEASGADIQTLPIGQVVQVHSLYCDVQHEGKTYLSVVRRTLTKISDGYIVVGDRVRFRTAETVKIGADRIDGEGHTVPGHRKDMPESVIEQILPRETVLTRSDSFKGIEQHPIVANADQMLIVASLRQPRIKWGIIDRMLVAAQCGKLQPIICLNKIDLAGPEDQQDKDVVQAAAALAHYQSLGVRILRTSAPANVGLHELREILFGHETVLAGHSGVGKSSLINSIQPHLKLRTAAVSGYTDKGRHTTTSARRYPLEESGAVIDTPGVKMFGLWGLTAANLMDYFPDIAAGTAPTWRQDSYERIVESLGG